MYVHRHHHRNFISVPSLWFDLVFFYVCYPIEYLLQRQWGTCSLANTTTYHVRFLTSYMNWYLCRVPLALPFSLVLTFQFFPCTENRVSLLKLVDKKTTILSCGTRLKIVKQKTGYLTGWREIHMKNKYIRIVLLAIFELFGYWIHNDFDEVRLKCGCFAICSKNGNRHGWRKYRNAFRSEHVNRRSTSNLQTRQIYGKCICSVSFHWDQKRQTNGTVTFPFSGIELNFLFHSIGLAQTIGWHLV